ncbi:phosphatase PAP2 family protein [Ramlibacter montanisoli]|uniref:Phosphatase PAP2 family protein n=1 Tax=Ramlibacter montanisoli TaxID=2732512 RepID=A0A849KEH8_9BURK|nr:phosphatase PAP2 family protein [Ramlibacter montanisoli]NNU43355.1 phosphatase PAP2 family protein [Ramlibacter montanisoli]
MDITASGPVTLPSVTIRRPGRPLFVNELAEVLNYAELREDRAAEILAQIDSQFAFWAAILQMRPDLTPKTYELLNVALQLAIFVEMRFKHELGCWRPVNYSPDVQPMVTTPGHGSLPMGHAAQAYMTACILCELADPNANNAGLRAMLYRQAFRMSFNRIVAGVHFPVDLPPGAALGMALGEYFVRRCTVLDPCNSWNVAVVNGNNVTNTQARPLQQWEFDEVRYATHTITQPGFLDGYRANPPHRAGTCPTAWPLRRT